MALEYILALDYGEKRIGVAIAHTVARLPRPLLTLQNTADTLSDIQKLVEQENVAQIVVGLPRNMDGSYSAQTRAAEAFARELAATVILPVELVDETLTSVDAEAELAGTNYSKEDVDALAASYILERFLSAYSAGARL
jgi:putative Holliday junction resolvase